VGNYQTHPPIGGANKEVGAHFGDGSEIQGTLGDVLLIASFHQQPFGPGGVPQTIGGALVCRLVRGRYHTLKICVGFANSSGTSRIFGPLRDFVASGGNVEVCVGLANGITSRQAVEHLLMAGASVWGVDTRGSVLFHPKVYVLEGNAEAWAAVGSSNLTSDGLYRNFAASTLTDLDLTHGTDAAYLQELASWLAGLRQHVGNFLRLEGNTLRYLVTSGQLIDERAVQRRQRLGISARHGPPAGRGHAGIRIPPAPPPYPGLQGARTRLRPRRRGRARAALGVAATSAGAQSFAMTLSTFDCSHRTGVPGTPDMSIPKNVAQFFPPVSLQGRKYPDEYFGVILNDPPRSARISKYRIWQRPPGGTGHADWRVRVGHETIDLTSPGGGDILLFERLPHGSSPSYEVWIITTDDPSYPELRARCNRKVQATGRAGIKHYGLY